MKTDQHYVFLKKEHLNNSEEVTVRDDIQQIFIFLFKRFIYFMYMSIPALFSNTPEEGNPIPLKMAVSHHVVAGN